mmetsp:Transcript_7783/g.11685  ORF Transcript_7783/g.11685 Transcript_7783/m.11685 type:complete len:237 (+) Transcript_7783:88-798(+)
MKLVVPISFLSILALGSATNHRRRVHDLAKDRREKVQTRMLEHEGEDYYEGDYTECGRAYLVVFVDEELESTIPDEDVFCTDPTDELNYCTYIGDLNAESGFADTCAGLDGRVKLANYIVTGDSCEELYYDDYYQDDDYPEPYNLINSPECIPNTCTDKEVLDFLNSLYDEVTDHIEGCDVDITFPEVNTDGPKASKSKKMKKVKSIKMKKAKSMKEPKSSKAPKASKAPKSSMMR